MKNPSLLLLPLVCIILWGCPKDEPKPDEKPVDNRVPLTENFHLDFLAKDQTQTGNYLNTAPKCGEAPIVYKNIKFSVQAASKLESPDKQECRNVSNNSSSFFVADGSALVIDLSYYNNIKQIEFNLSEYCQSDRDIISVFLYDVDGMLIEKKGLNGVQDSRNGVVLSFNANLDRVKEARIVNVCEGAVRNMRMYKK